MITHNKPLEVSEVMRQKVIHAPRKSIEVKKKEEKKRKFPWLLATLIVVAVGTAAVLLLTKNNDNETTPEYMKIEWVHIPAGEFLMGDNFNEGDADELPVHPVYLDEYYISKYEITIEQYNYYCRQMGQYPHGLLSSMPGMYNRTDYLKDRPVFRNITWERACRFCDWFSRESGEDIHLPTEAQWEKAARGTKQNRYPWGNSEADCGKANFLGCPDDCYHEVYAVDTYPGSTSPYGVQNMAGNAWEWCLDWYDPLYYSDSPRENPRGPATGSYHVLRGGSAVEPAGEVRSANRRRGDIDSVPTYAGFRIVKEVKKRND